MANENANELRSVVKTTKDKADQLEGQLGLAAASKVKLSANVGFFQSSGTGAGIETINKCKDAVQGLSGKCADLELKLAATAGDTLSQGGSSLAGG